jgi:hypothetical protein
LDIYIYGGDSFKRQIHKTLDHGNIRFKIDGGEVIDVKNIDNMKNFIINHPHEIFLIDQNKIIENNIVHKYLKFFVPKDGINKDFLDQHGVGDISLRDYDDLILYIEKRLLAIEELKPKANEITSIEEMLEDDTLSALNI